MGHITSGFDHYLLVRMHRHGPHMVPHPGFKIMLTKCLYAQGLYVHSVHCWYKSPLKDEIQTFLTGQFHACCVISESLREEHWYSTRFNMFKCWFMNGAQSACMSMVQKARYLHISHIILNDYSMTASGWCTGRVYIIEHDLVWLL